MQKLTALRFVKHNNDFHTLLKVNLSTIHDINLDTLSDKHACRYIIETRELIETLHTSKQSANDYGTIELCDAGTLKFSPESYENEFRSLMNSDYFDLINFDSNKVDLNQYTTIGSWRNMQ
jgi:hypothetical protein